MSENDSSLGAIFDDKLFFWNRLRIKGVRRIATEGNLKHDTAILGLACFQRAADDIGTKAYDAQAQPLVIKPGAMP